MSHQTVSIGLVSEELVTAVADLYWSFRTDVHLLIDVRKPLDWNRIRAKLARKLGDARFDKLIFSGHGVPASLDRFIQLEDLQREDTEQVRFLRFLKERALPGASIRLCHCEVAQGERGKEFLALFGKWSGCRVHAWDDWYAIYPFGREFVGAPSGEWEFVRDTNRRWQGSWLQFFHVRERFDLRLVATVSNFSQRYIW
jgi:hypothetical protein